MGENRISQPAQRPILGVARSSIDLSFLNANGRKKFRKGKQKAESREEKAEI